jgi:nicotinamide-nucleotide amidase
MSTFSDPIVALATQLIMDCKSRGLMIATAESCTGGLISGALTDIAGSSAVVDRGFVTYTNTAKMEMLGVQAATLATYGAVSHETALQMVQGALFRSRAALAVAVTGIAGPGGGAADKPVGLVHLAARARSGRILHREMHYGELGRNAVRLATVATALEMLLELAQA